MLYQWDIGREPLGRVLESFWQFGEPAEAVREFAGRLVEGTVSHLEEIDSLIAASAENWRLPRMAAVDRNILRLAVYEFLYERTPGKVVINEALEVTKKFSTPEAVQFVNGILDAVRQKIEAAREAR